MKKRATAGPYQFSTHVAGISTPTSTTIRTMASRKEPQNFNNLIPSLYAGETADGSRAQYTLGPESVQPTTGTSGAMTKISTRRFFCRWPGSSLGAAG